MPINPRIMRIPNKSKTIMLKGTNFALQICIPFHFVALSLLFFFYRFAAQQTAYSIRSFVILFLLSNFQFVYCFLSSVCARFCAKLWFRTVIISQRMLFHGVLANALLAAIFSTDFQLFYKTLELNNSNWKGIARSNFSLYQFNW